LAFPHTAPSSEELDPELPIRRRAPKSSSTSPHGLASTPPWSRLTTSDHRPSSEELDLKLPTRSRGPKTTLSRRRETAPRLRGSTSRPLTLDRAPKNPTSSCRPAPALRRTPRPTSARPRCTSVETPHVLWLLAQLRRVKLRAARSLRLSEDSLGAQARDRVTSPWKRPETPHSQLGSEESSCELLTCIDRPKTASAQEREIAQRLRGNDRRPLTLDRAPKSSASSCRLAKALRGAPTQGRRETASRLRERPPTPTDRAPRPEDRDT
jgi:hypothetical protein